MNSNKYWSIKYRKIECPEYERDSLFGDIVCAENLEQAKKKLESKVGSRIEIISSELTNYA